MSPLNRRYTLEALIAASILALLLMLMMPRFFAAQIYGPIGPDDCDYLEGKWTWKDGVLYQERYEDNIRADLFFKHEFTNLDLSFKVWLPQGGDNGFNIIFGKKGKPFEEFSRIDNGDMIESCG